MTCADVRLDEYLDGELDEPVRRGVEAHLASCPECRGELEKSRGLESLLQRAVPSGAAPDTDRFLQLLQSRSRRRGGWAFAVAAAALLGVLSIVLSSLRSRPVDVREQLVLYSQKKDMDGAESRIRAAGAAALPVLERALDDADVTIQFAAATLLFKLSDEKTRDRVLARFQQGGEKGGGWTLMPVGLEEEDVEIIPVAVSLASEGQERWAMDVLKRLNRLDRLARGKVVESVVTLLHSTNVKVQKLALDIVKELEIEFPLPAIVDLLDSPELGDEALRILREATKKDFGKDKEAWKKAVEHEEEL